MRFAIHTALVLLCLVFLIYHFFSEKKPLQRESSQEMVNLIDEQLISNDGQARVLIPGGVYTPGIYQKSFVRLRSVVEETIRVEPFLFDIHPVTVGQYEQFILDSGYSYQSVGSYQEIFGNNNYDVRGASWIQDKEASYKYPLGLKHSESESDHPVTQVTHGDAEEYCTFYGGRLPTEFEWEYVARNLGKNTELYPWGDNSLFDEKGMSRANTWNPMGSETDKTADGYILTAPVGQTGFNKLGISDMAGNVWEWTSTDHTKHANDVDHGMSVYAPGEKVLKGGSFACNARACHGFSVFTRMHAHPEQAMFHTGFRCVADQSSAEE